MVTVGGVFPLCQTEGNRMGKEQKHGKQSEEEGKVKLLAATHHGEHICALIHVLLVCFGEVT